MKTKIYQTAETVPKYTRPPKQFQNIPDRRNSSKIYQIAETVPIYTRPPKQFQNPIVIS